MPGESLHAAVEALRARLQSDLDAQLADFQTQLESQHQAAAAAAALAATTAADEAWSAKFAAASAESAQQREEDRARFDAERAASASTHQAAPDTGDTLARLSTSLLRIGQASSLTATLDALLAEARDHAERVNLFVAVPGAGEAQALKPWGSVSTDDPAVRDLVAVARRSGKMETASGGDTAAIPVIVGDRPVAVLHATRPAASPSLDAAIVLAHHAAACLGRLTAVRVTQVMTGTPDRNADDGARRYARLLVSEIKLYNEAAVRTGRERGDLLARLGPEIDRARRLYEQRVPASHDRATVFHHELVQTLAAGDASRLGAVQ